LLNRLFPLKDWNPAREAFTKQTTALMYQNNPDRRRWPAVACYNKGWSVKDRSRISDVVSMRLNLGAFHTNYDCMYVGHNNQFYTESDGGYINVSFSSYAIPPETNLLFHSLPTCTIPDTAATMDAPATLPATRDYVAGLEGIFEMVTSCIWLSPLQLLLGVIIHMERISYPCC
jgi:hypothetical protein